MNGRSARWFSWPLGLVLAGVLVLATAPGAEAHAVLVQSTPRDGSTVATAPAAVELRFDEPVQLVPDGAHVIAAADGSEVGAGGAAVDGDTLRVPLQSQLPRGRYLVSWQVISADGHQVAGSIRFGVQVPAGAAVATQTPPVTAADRAHDVATGVGPAGAVLLVGVPLGCWALGAPGSPWTSTRRRRWRRLVGAGWVVSLAAALLLWHADAARVAGGGLASAAGLPGHGAWAQVRGSHAGAMVALRLLALVLLPVAWWWRARATSDRGRGAATGAVALLAGALVLSLAWVGHAAVGLVPVVAAVVAVAHVLAMVVWLGGVVALVSGLGPDTLHDRWSRVAAACVAVLVVSGVVQALRQVHPWGSLWDTRYGVLLLVKVGVVLVALAAAARVRRRLVGGGAGLRRRAGVEAALLAGVVVVTSLLVAAVPARESYGPSAALSAPLGPDRLVVSVDSTRRGAQDISIRRTGADPRLSAVAGTLQNPAAGVTGLPVHFERGPDGSWHSQDAEAPLPGTWTLRLDVDVDRDTGYATSVSYRVW